MQVFFSKVVFCSVFLFGLLIFGPMTSTPFAAEKKVGFVDIQKAVISTKEWKRSFETFKKNFAKEKKKIKSREARIKKMLADLLDKHRSNNGNFDCIVPVSGGKDGSYVAYNLKHKKKVNPLTVTIRPPLEEEIGKRNLKLLP